MCLRHCLYSFSGNINEALVFEYGDETVANQGCAATLKNEFWYFGGASDNMRKVKSRNDNANFYLYYFRQVK